MNQHALNRTQADHPIDLCVETTTWCNLSCQNCFSESLRGFRGRHLPYQIANEHLRQKHDEVIRFSLTGGEPFMNPEVASFLTLPEKFPEIGYVITTNGTIRSTPDSLLVENDWLVAVSLHGGSRAHDAYAGFPSFAEAKRRIVELSKRLRVHIYCVLHDELTVNDIDWLIKFRGDSGARFLRFITPRQFGRYRSLTNTRLLQEVQARLDDASAIKRSASNTLFLAADGTLRMSA